MLWKSENREEKVSAMENGAAPGGGLLFSLPSLTRSQDHGSGGVVHWWPSATLIRLSPEKLGWLREDLQVERKAGLMEG